MAETILETIAAYAKVRVAAAKDKCSFNTVRRDAELDNSPRASFLEALSQPGLSVIAELKKASPSKGLICPDFENIYLQQAERYALGGAAAISCLTEPKWFLGKDEFLVQAHRTVELPILRKDFTVDEYQIYEAKLLGASAVLLICSLMNGGQLDEYLCLTHEIGLHALVEAHTDKEVEQALKAGADIIGVNNRNLKDFTVNPTNSLRLRSMIPAGKIFVAESGISQASDCDALKAAGVGAVLIGEALMRSGNAKAMIEEISNR